MEDDVSDDALELSELGNPEVRDRMKTADVIFGIDLSTCNKTVFWGRAFLRKIINGAEPQEARTITFQYDQRDDSLERLFAAVKVIKGACSYSGTDVLSDK